jgi:hypothetical protein
MVCEIIGSDFYGGKATRKARTMHRRPGYDISHVQPFVTHGEGEVFIEPASINRARGAQPVEDLDE